MAEINLSKNGGGGKKKEKKEELGSGKLFLVTGGTGFVGFHLVNYLLGVCCDCCWSSFCYYFIVIIIVLLSFC